MHTRLYKNKNRGFTLIELLVVIAIIGILSAVVLASVNTARARARDAQIVASLKNIVPQAELYFDSNNSYLNLCTDPQITKMVSSIDNTVSTAKCYVRSDGKRWAVSAAIKSDSNKNWSVDTAGVVAWDVDRAAGGGNVSWYDAVLACSSIGARLPSLEQLMTLNMVYNGLPPILYGYYHWAGNSYDSDESQAWDTNPAQAPITEEDHTPKSNTSPHAHCVR